MFEMGESVREKLRVSEREGERERERAEESGGEREQGVADGCG